MLALVFSNAVQFEKLFTFLFTLSILVVLHELGHFIVARRNGVRVNEFAVGFGPKLLKWKSPRSGTTYALNLLPIGGYCAMQGEDGKTSEAQQKRAFESAPRTYDPDNFQAKSTWQRLAIIVAGPAANFVLAFLILFGAATIFGVGSDANQPIVGPLVDGLPAQKAGLHAGDKVLSINGARIHNGRELLDTIHGALGKSLLIGLSHNGTPYSVRVTPAHCPPGQNHANWGCIGFYPVAEIVRVPVGVAFTQSLVQMRNMWDQTIGSFALLVSHPRQYGGSVSGIVGMGRAASAVQDFGWAPYLQLAALISFSLGIFNLLPFPALDGGRGVFIVAEMLRGKPVDPEKEALVHVAGFAMLMLLMIAVTYHDIANIVTRTGPF